MKATEWIGIAAATDAGRKTDTAPFFDTILTVLLARVFPMRVEGEVI